MVATNMHLTYTFRSPLSLWTSVHISPCVPGDYMEPRSVLECNLLGCRNSGGGLSDSRFRD